MGQAKRRRETLGVLYGTPESSTAARPLQLRAMDAEAIEQAHLSHLATDSALWFLIGSVGDEQCPIVVRPTIDAAGQFNSHVQAFMPKGAHTSILQGRRKTADHQAINRYLLEQSDVVIARA